MSRNPFRSSKTQKATSQPAAHDGPADDALIAEAHALYGSGAATAVAYCGLDAWFEGEEAEFRLFARLFRRLMN